MVGPPNRTGRCNIFIKCMKVKALSSGHKMSAPFWPYKQCDLSRPTCSRCRRLGLRFEYIIAQQGYVFINRSVTNPSWHILKHGQNEAVADLRSEASRTPKDRCNNDCIEVRYNYYSESCTGVYFIQLKRSLQCCATQMLLCNSGLCPIESLSCGCQIDQLRMT